MHLNSPSDSLTLTISPFSAGTPNLNVHIDWEERPSVLDEAPPILGRFNDQTTGSGTSTHTLVGPPPQGKTRKIVYMSFVNVGVNPVTVVGKIGGVTVFSFNISNTVDDVVGMITWTDEGGFLANSSGQVGISNSTEVTTTAA